jgi:RimJ/RimL family protein N-acetyltransferase
LILIVGHDKAISRWVADRVGVTVSDFGACKTMGFVDRDTLVAGVVFHNFRALNVEASIATESPRWCNRGVLHAIFHYPFVQAGCSRVTATTEATNQPVRAFLCRLGFQQEGVLRQFLPSGDMVVYGLLRDECRWLRTPDGQAEHARAS